MQRTLGAAAAMLAGAPAAAWAHPGHGSTDPATVTHFLLEPEHLLPLVLLGLAGALGIAIKRKRDKAPPDDLAREVVRKKP
ncbi:MAG: hypothetical protein KF774_06145 [Planctomyces sp.]|nr:hypothetical protein [Planctomyces sp.]